MEVSVGADTELVSSCAATASTRPRIDRVDKNFMAAKESDDGRKSEVVMGHSLQMPTILYGAFLVSTALGARVLCGTARSTAVGWKAFGARL